MSQHLNNSSQQSEPNNSWPPKWLTPVSEEDRERGDGDLYIKFTEAVCRVTKDSVAASAGELMNLRNWQQELLMHALARKANGRFKHRAA